MKAKYSESYFVNMGSRTIGLLISDIEKFSFISFSRSSSSDRKPELVFRNQFLIVEAFKESMVVFYFFISVTSFVSGFVSAFILDSTVWGAPNDIKPLFSTLSVSFLHSDGAPNEIRLCSFSGTSSSPTDDYYCLCSSIFDRWWTIFSLISALVCSITMV